MAESINLETVRRVAHLARLPLSDDQADAARADLNRILDYVGLLESVSLDEQTPPFFGVEVEDPEIRDDQVRPSVERDQMLANAPDSDGEFYRVPPVL